MKKVLIVTNNMNIGGIQKALLELLKALSRREDLSISLFCCSKSGIFLERVPKAIKLLPENKWAKVSELTAEACKKMGLPYFIFRVSASVWSKLLHKGLPARWLCASVGELGNYDIAISFSQPIHDKAFCNLTNEIVINCCQAKRRITFVHCDFANYGGNTKYNRALYERFDAVAAVSESVGNKFLNCVPNMHGKVYTVYNFCDTEEILRLAAEQPVRYSQKTVVTVARLSEEKGLLRCVPIFARLKSEGVQVCWHIVGGGPLESQLKSMICEYGLEENVVLEGQQTNPYRFLKNADYLFLPSLHEAAPVVFDEAIALGIPILTTDTLSSKEMVSDRNAGFVCGSQDEDIYRMLHDAFRTRNAINNAVPTNREQCMKQFDRVCGIEE